MVLWCIVEDDEDEPPEPKKIKLEERIQGKILGVYRKTELWGKGQQVMSQLTIILYMYSKNKFHDEFCNLKINSQVNDRI